MTVWWQFFRLLGDDDGDDDADDDGEDVWQGWRECVRGQKKIGMFGDRSIGHALMKQNDRKRGRPRRRRRDGEKSVRGWS